MDGKVPWDWATGQSIPADSSTFEFFIYNPLNSFFLGQFGWDHPSLRASLVAQMIKNLPAMWETWVRTLGWEDPWRGAGQPTPMFLPGESPWTEEPGGLQSMGSQWVRHDWVTKQNPLSKTPLQGPSSDLLTLTCVILLHATMVALPPLPSLNTIILFISVCPSV